MYLLLLTSLTLAYIGAVTLHRLFFHPLRRYPGPGLAALTEGYEAYYNIVKGAVWLNEIERLHKIYGPVVRIAPNRLHFNYPQAYHDIYTHGATLTKDPDLYHAMAAHFRESGFATCDPYEAKMKRNQITPLFSRRAVMELEYTIQQKVNQLIEIFEKHYSSPDSGVEMYPALRSLTTDIITSYCFAECPNTLEYVDFSHPLVKNLEETFQGFWVQRHFPWIVSWINDGPERLVLWLFPKYEAYVGLRTKLQNQIDKILKNPEILSSAEHDTVYRHLLQNKDGKPPSRATLLHEAIAIIGAGSDTVGNNSYVGTFYALKYPSIGQRLSEELREAWPDKDMSLSYTALEKLPYLTAFIKETLRFAVGVVYPLPRIVGPTTPEIGGLKLPSGSVVEMSPVFMHFNPDVYPDPYQFDPDRWLSGETAEMERDLVPFSKGARMCLGMNLAWCELYLIFGNIFRRLNMKLIVNEDTIDEFSSEHRLDYFSVQWRKGYRATVESAKA